MSDSDTPAQSGSGQAKPPKPTVQITYTERELTEKINEWSATGNRWALLNTGNTLNQFRDNTITEAKKKWPKFNSPWKDGTDTMAKKVLKMAERYFSAISSDRITMENPEAELDEEADIGSTPLIQPGRRPHTAYAPTPRRDIKGQKSSTELTAIMDMLQDMRHDQGQMQQQIDQLTHQKLQQNMNPPASCSNNQPQCPDDPWAWKTDERLAALPPGSIQERMIAYMEQYALSPNDGLQQLSTLRVPQDKMSVGHVASAASKQIKFDGDQKGTTGPFKFWLHMVMQQSMGVPESMQQLFWNSVFMQCLTGKAQEKYMGIRISRRHDILYVVDKLIEIYRQEHQVYSVADWYNLKATQGESVSSLHTRLSAEFYHISETMSDEDREQMIGDKLFSEVPKLVPSSCWYMWRTRWMDKACTLNRAVTQMDAARIEVERTRMQRKEEQSQKSRQRYSWNRNWQGERRGPDQRWQTEQKSYSTEETPDQVRATLDPKDYKGPWCTYHLHRNPMAHHPSKCFVNPASPEFKPERERNIRQNMEKQGRTEEDTKRVMARKCAELGIPMNGEPELASRYTTQNDDDEWSDDEPKDDWGDVEDWVPGIASTKTEDMECSRSTIDPDPIATITIHGIPVRGHIDTGCNIGLFIEDTTLEAVWAEAGMNPNTEREKFRPYTGSHIRTSGNIIKGEWLRIYDITATHRTPDGVMRKDILPAVVKLAEFLPPADPLLIGRAAIWGNLQIVQTAHQELERLSQAFSGIAEVRKTEETEDETTCTADVHTLQSVTIPAGQQHQVKVGIDKQAKLPTHAGDGSQIAYAIDPFTREWDGTLRERVPGITCDAIFRTSSEWLTEVDFPIFVTNTTGYDQYIPAHTKIAEIFTTTQALVAEEPDEEKAQETRELPTPPAPAQDIPIERELTKDEEHRIDEIWARFPKDSQNALPKELEGRFKNLLAQQKGLFSLSEYDIGETQVTEHKIELIPGAEPIKCAARFETPPKRAFVWRTIDEMLKKKLIVPSASPWAFPLVIVPKGKSDYRLCLDFRKLNDITVRDAYPLPRIADMFQQMSGREIFSTMDASFGYYNVTISDPATRDMVSFVCSRGQYSYTRMPLGLKNAGASFQRLMDCVLTGLNYEPERPAFFAYIDDCLVTSNEPEEHLRHLVQLFHRLQWAGIRLKPEKCHFFCTEVKFLGFELSKKGIAPKRSNIAAILEMSTPKTKQEIKTFLGKAGYFSQHIPGFHRLAAPLNEMAKGKYRVKGNDPIPPHSNWTTEAKNAYETLKQKLSRTPVLAHPDRTKEYYLYTDACDIGLGAVLMQKDSKDPSQLRPISFISKRLPTTHKNWSTIEKEALACTWALDRLGDYIDGQKVILRTDHKALVNALIKPAHGKIERWTHRWAMRLSLKDLSIEYCPGEQNVVADALSRNPIDDTDTAAFHRASESIRVPIEKLCPHMARCTQATVDWEREQSKDPECAKLKERIKSNEMGAAQYTISNGTIHYEGPHGPQPLAPRHMREWILDRAHAGLLGTHGGAERIVQQISRAAAWPGMRQDAEKWVKKCQICKITKDGQRKGFSPLFPVSPGTQPWQKVAIDTTPMPEFKGHKHILVAVDYLTRSIALAPIRQLSGKAITQALEKHVIHRFGPPAELVSDNGTEFVNRDITQMAQKWGIKLRTTTPYHSQSNGLAERAIRSVEQLTRQWTQQNEGSRDWPSALPEIALRMNVAYNRDVAHAPFELLFGYMPALLSGDSSKYQKNSEEAQQSPPSSNTRLQTTLRALITHIPEVAQRPGKMQNSWQQARMQLQSAQERYKKSYDKRKSGIQFKIGDEVYKDTRWGMSVEQKIQPLRTGPHTIIGMDKSIALLDMGSYIQRAPVNTLTYANAIENEKNKKSAHTVNTLPGPANNMASNENNNTEQNNNNASRRPPTSAVAWAATNGQQRPVSRVPRPEGRRQHTPVQWVGFARHAQAIGSGVEPPLLPHTTQTPPSEGQNRGQAEMVAVVANANRTVNRAAATTPGRARSNAAPDPHNTDTHKSAPSEQRPAAPPRADRKAAAAPPKGNKPSNEIADLRNCVNLLSSALETLTLHPREALPMLRWSLNAEARLRNERNALQDQLAHQQDATAAEQQRSEKLAGEVARLVTIVGPPQQPTPAPTPEPVAAPEPKVTPEPELDYGSTSPYLSGDDLLPASPPVGRNGNMPFFPFTRLPPLLSPLQPSTSRKSQPRAPTPLGDSSDEEQADVPTTSFKKPRLGKKK